jgi:hypothetical protein
MIIAIEGLIPDRRSSPSGTQPAAPPITADIYAAKWLRKQQQQAAGEDSGDADDDAESQPDAPQVPDPQPAPNPAPAEPPPPPYPAFNRDFDRNQPSLPDPLIPQRMNRVPLAEDRGFNALLETANSSRQPFSLKKNRFGRRR